MARPALAATRALDIISFLTEHGDESFTMAQLTRALRLNQGSAHAVLTALTDEGFLSRHPVHRTFRLGPALVAVGDAASRANPVIAVAREELRSLADELGLEALASMRAGTSLRVVVRVGDPTGRGPMRRVGQSYPLVPPLGAVLVAWAPDSVRRAWFAALPAAATRPEHVVRLEQLLAAIVERGYVVGGEGPRRAEIGRAAQALADDPLDEARAEALRQRVVQAIEEPTWDPQEVGEFRPAAVTVPVFDPHGEAALECVVHGFTRAMATTELLEVVERARRAATVITRRTWAHSTA
jgi:DNA-binding IclR family transcriptional regulator